VLCQARADTDHDGKLSVQYDIHRTHGDQVDTYLVLDTGLGERIDYPAARSAHGEWVAVVHDGKLELIDGATFHRVPLAADLTDDYTWTEQKNSRFISIAANATRLAYLRRDNAIVIRELPSGTERVVPMTAKVWRATVDAGDVVVSPSSRRISSCRSDPDHAPRTCSGPPAWDRCALIAAPGDIRHSYHRRHPEIHAGAGVSPLAERPLAVAGLNLSDYRTGNAYFRARLGAWLRSSYAAPTSGLGGWSSMTPA